MKYAPLGTPYVPASIESDAPRESVPMEEWDGIFGRSLTALFKERGYKVVRQGARLMVLSRDDAKIHGVKRMLPP